MKDIITSSKNAQLKEISALLKSKKERDEQGLFVIEGLRIMKDALMSGRELIKTVYMSDEFDVSTLGMQFGDFDREKINYEIVKASVFNDISGTVSSQGVLAVVKKPEYSLNNIIKNIRLTTNALQEDKLKSNDLNDSNLGNTDSNYDDSKTSNVKMSGSENAKYLLLEDIQDPGNLGTMIRTAEAAGMSAIIMSSSTVDIFNPKVTRSTMGSCFRVPFVYAKDFAGAVEQIKQNGVRVYAAYLHGGRNYKEVKFAENCAIMIGNEGNGLTDEAVNSADERVFIPMAGQIESLNAAVAASILMYSI